jgi:hypothetical protein
MGGLHHGIVLCMGVSIINRYYGDEISIIQLNWGLKNGCYWKKSTIGIGIGNGRRKKRF